MLASCSPQELELIKANVTPDLVRKSIQEGQQLSVHKKEDPVNLVLSITLLLTNCVKSLNVARTMTEEQIGSLVGAIIKQYWYYKLEEIIHVLENGKQGKYGKLYEGLDAEKIHSWFLSYDTAERLQLCELNRMKAQEAAPMEAAAVVEHYHKLSIGEPTATQILESKQKARERQQQQQNNENARFKALYDEHNIRIKAEFFSQNPHGTEEEFAEFKKERPFKFQ